MDVPALILFGILDCYSKFRERWMRQFRELLFLLARVALTLKSLPLYQFITKLVPEYVKKLIVLLLSLDHL
jgi:hypothetical protein